VTPPLVWALTPYLIRNRRLVGESYDNEQTKAEIAAAFHSLGMPWVWQPVVPECIDEVLAQIARYREKNDAMIFNFCDGDDINGYPGLSLLRALEASGIPFTGAHARFYEISTSKILIKKALIRAGVPTAPFAIVPHTGPAEGLCERIGAPLFLKPATSAAG
jgi:D-alanine-D-alanine ligase